MRTAKVISYIDNRVKFLEQYRNKNYTAPPKRARYAGNQITSLNMFPVSKDEWAVECMLGELKLIKKMLVKE